MIRSKKFFLPLLILLALNVASFLFLKLNQPELTLAKRDSATNQALLLAATRNEFLIISSDRSREFSVPPAVLSSWLEKFRRDYTGQQEFRFNFNKIERFLRTEVKIVTKNPTNAGLGIDTNGQLMEKTKHQNGLILKPGLTSANIAAALMTGQNWAEIGVEEKEPEITLGKVKKLGINNLLGRGESNFAGSPEARMQNIEIGTKKFDGVLVPAGEEFSFNKFLGPVDQTNGYRAELVIKNKTLVPEYGGGLCQVSTTLFRAAMAAGLPIIERRSHSLPVRYYSPQGFDATVYPGQVDFRFKNDSPGPLLVQSQIVGSTISFEIFGSSDGRKTSLIGPTIYEAGPDGSMKTWLKRITTADDGTQKTDVFYSSYKSPSLFPTIRNPLE